MNIVEELGKEWEVHRVTKAHVDCTSKQSAFFDRGAYKEGDGNMVHLTGSKL
jgi:hypothetical protein